jgi:hypothetical protein
VKVSVPMTVMPVPLESFAGENFHASAARVAQANRNLQSYQTLFFHQFSSLGS